MIAKDSAFAPAYAGLADAWAVMSVNRMGVPPDDAFAVMVPAARKALQLDPLLAEAHAAMGRRPGPPTEVARGRGVLSACHRPQPESVADSYELRDVHALAAGKGRTVRQSTPCGFPSRSVVSRPSGAAGVGADQRGRYDESIAMGRRIVPSMAAADDGLNLARQQLARALFLDGEHQEAFRRFDQLGRGTDNFRGYAYAAAGRRAEAEALVLERQDFPASLALIYAGLADKDRAFEALQRMVADKDPRVGIYLTYPELGLLQTDPRMAELRRKLGLPH